MPGLSSVTRQQGGPKSRATTFEDPHFGLYLQNASTNLYDFWHASMPVYSEQIC